MAAYEAFVAGMENFLRYNYADARHGFEVAVQKAPDFAMARYRLAHTLAALGDTDAALEHVRQAQQDAYRLPARDRAYIDAGASYFARDFATAARQYRELLETIRTSRKRGCCSCTCSSTKTGSRRRWSKPRPSPRRIPVTKSPGAQSPTPPEARPLR